MRGSNSYGSYRTTRDADMAAHDACPPLLRQVVNYAVLPWASRPILDDWLRLAMPFGPAEAARCMARHIAAEDFKDTAKFYGPTHPEAQPSPTRGPE